jgi:thiamine biosynthesis lipoprotein
VSFTGAAQGTYYAVTYYDHEGRNFQPQVDSLLRAFDQSVSLWEPKSVISRVNKGDTSVVLDETFKYNFLLSKEVSATTDGAFDFTIAPLVTAWGFGLKEKENITQPMIDSLKEFVDYRKVGLEGGKVIRQDNRIKFDFNAVAQGHSVDLICAMLESYGINSYIVDVGGEVFARNTKPDGTEWRVGIEKPATDKENAQEIQMIVALQNKGIATSGNYRKYYEENGKRYSHTIDPSTGYPVDHNLLSVTVLAGNAALADAYSTAFMVMGVDRALELLKTLPDMEAIFISSSTEGTYETLLTPGFQECLRE